MNETPEHIANRIAEYLFQTGDGDKADRLLLITEDYSGRARVTDARYLGGWSKPAVTDAVLKIIRGKD